MNVVYSFTHTVEVGATIRTAWDFWTQVENWALDAAIESVSLDGGFENGSTGVTKTRDGQLIKWSIAEVEGKRAVIEVPMPGATGRFEWSFAGRPDGGTTITQSISLWGAQAEAYLPMMGEAFEQGIRDGMGRLAAEIDR